MKIPGRAQLAQWLGAVGDPACLRILELLSERDLSTRELAGFLATSEPVVSRRLSALVRAGAVSKRRSGYFVMYALQRQAVADAAQALTLLS